MKIKKYIISSENPDYHSTVIYIHVYVYVYMYVSVDGVILTVIYGTWIYTYDMSQVRHTLL